MALFYTLTQKMTVFRILVYVIINQYVYPSPGVDHSSDFLHDPIRLVALLFFVAVFYVPIHYAHSLEDFTFAQTRWQKIERLGSFLLVVLVLMIRN